MKKIAKFIVNGIDHMVNLIALLLVLMTMFLSCYMLWDSNQVYQAADAKTMKPIFQQKNIQNLLKNYRKLIRM